MLRQAALAAAPFLLVGSAGSAAPEASLDWIAGHWCADLGDETVEEFWLPPHGGVTVGLSRVRTADATAGFEYLRIEERGGVRSYVAQPGGRPPTAFRQTAAGEGWIRFENAAHDFPQRIEYRRDGDALHAETAGPGDNGTDTVIPFAFERCDARIASATVATTDRFEFRSDPRVSLHHFLLAWAAADHDGWPPYALPIAERGSWRAVLDEDEVRDWSAAVASYAGARDRDVVFDEGLIALRDWAAGIAARTSIPARDRPLADALEQALPVYLRHWWPAHDAQSRAWIDALAPALRVVENDLAAALEAAYGGRWPEASVPVDVVVYCNAVGAYSTGGRVTISGADGDNRMPQALELVFHEASHVESLEAPLNGLVEQAFRAAGGDPPERFWHDLIFFTTGTLTRRVLDEQHQPGYRHYGEFGVYRRGERWPAQLPLLEKHWRPFLESASGDASQRVDALQAVAGHLAAQ